MSVEFKANGLRVAWALAAGFLVGLGASRAGAESGLAAAGVPVLTNVLQLRQAVWAERCIGYPVRLEGVVLWPSQGAGQLFLQDDSGAMSLPLNLRHQPAVAAGQLVRVEGRCAAGQGLLRAAVVDNDGLHPPEEKSGAAYLAAGRHPLRVDWFNGPASWLLEVEYQGPGLPRQRIPPSALFRAEVGSAQGSPALLPGLDYHCYEGEWKRLPDFQQLQPVKAGTVTNLDLAVRTRNQQVGLEFSGYLEVPREGLYTFWTRSDDGSRLFVGEPGLRVNVRGAAPVPAPRRVVPGQVLSPEQANRWSEVEGTVHYVTEQAGALQFDLSSDTGRLRVEVVEPAGLSRWLLNSRVRVSGICQNTYASDGQQIAGALLAPSAQQVELLEAAPQSREQNPLVPMGGPGATNEARNLPVLVTVDQIKRLDRKEAQRGYPVRIRGVAIGVWPYGAFSLQDATWAVYVEGAPGLEGPRPRVGEYWEVEGETFAGFAPNVRPRRAVRLGAGRLPEPLRPTWDQLSNGSLDTQYVELQGIITAIEPGGAAFLTRSGKLKVQFPGMEAQALQRYQNALVRVRGCLSPRYDPRTQQAQVGQIRLFSASFEVDQPAPANPFEAPLKHASELLLFDPQAGALQRVRLAGQVLGERNGEYYLMDGDYGVRFIPQAAAELSVGDVVEVVGFAELGGPSPLLREAVVRRTGRAGLPAARALAEGTFLNGRYDATLVQVNARLVGLSVNQSGQALELQTGTREFVARLPMSHGLRRGLVPGSQLELTGVYAGRGGNRALGRDIDSFELLVNAPADIRVLERPAWWTLGHTLAVVGGMASVILAALVWITLLRRQVEERSRELAAEIHGHEQTERQRALEADRARIARDLHDDLGASLTGISLLAEVGPGAPPTLEKAGQRFRAIRAKARETVDALDVIVWLVNPRKDTLPSLASYVASFAEEYLSASGIACELKIPIDLPPVRLTADTRQCLFLALKEALHNAVRHSRAGKVEVRLSLEQGGLELALIDDGRGFDAATVAQGNGLDNLRERLAQLGGSCEIRSTPDLGTQVRLRVPVAEAKPAQQPKGGPESND